MLIAPTETLQVAFTMLLLLVKVTMLLASVCRSSLPVPRVHSRVSSRLLSIYSVVLNLRATTLRHLSSSLAIASPAATSRHGFVSTLPQNNVAAAACDAVIWSQHYTRTIRCRNSSSDWGRGSKTYVVLLVFYITYQVLGIAPKIE
jgi:hypothetical protein